MGRIWATVHCKLTRGSIALILHTDSQRQCYGGIQELRVKYKLYIQHKE